MRVWISAAASAKAIVRVVSCPCARQVGIEAGGEVLRRERADVLGVDGVGLLLVETRRVGVDVDDIEGGDHLVGPKTS